MFDPIAPDDPRFAAAARLLFGACADEARRCLHAHGHGAPELLEADLRRIAQEGDLRLLASADAMIAADVDRGAKRAWLWGPAAAAHDAPSLTALYRAMQQNIRHDADRASAFLHVRNTEAVAALEAAGGVRTGLVHVYSAERPAAPAAAPMPGVRDAAPDDAAGVAALHDAAFPATYLPAARMAELAASGDARLLVAGPPGSVVAYVFVQAKEDGTGYVDFLGVDPAHRGRGLGRALLDAGLAWLFRDRGARAVSLTVRADNPGAISLYRDAGFRLAEAGVALDWRWPHNGNDPNEVTT